MTTRPETSVARTWFIKIWQRFCRLVVQVFYHRFEVNGLDHLPENTGLILCANHVNALADAVVLQASTHKAIRPLARHGLFKNPLLRPLLELIGTVPLYRRKDSNANPSRNDESFTRCYELLAQNETLIIFPEGQSHDDPHLHELKTGAARMALGAVKVNKSAPTVLPVGLTFTRKGTFRSDVLVNYGPPIDLSIPSQIDAYNAVHLLTDRIAEGLSDITLNATSWEDIEMVARLENFFALRQGKYRQENLKQRFRAMQRLIKAQKLLRLHEPSRVRSLITHLKMYERLCRYFGIKDYHLTVNYRPIMISLYFLRGLGVLLLGFPIALWGIVNSFLPFQLTRHLSHRIAKNLNQYDTTKILLGLLFFLLFWGLQTLFIHYNYGIKWTLSYIASLIIGAAAALLMRGEYRLIWDNIKVFFLFLRKRKLRKYLENKRHEIERELAKLVRIAKYLEGKY